MKNLNISFILMTAAMVVTAIILFRILRRILEPKTTSNLIKEYSSDYITEKKKKVSRGNCIYRNFSNCLRNKLSDFLKILTKEYTK